MLCIISSGTENLSIVKLCQLYNIRYEIIIDTLAWPYDDREHDYVLGRVQKIIKEHQKNGDKLCHYIVSPSIELGLSTHDEIFCQKYIFPLFSSYLSYCFTHSRSGRLGILGGHSDNIHIERYIQTQSGDYKKTDQQAKTKRFLFPFSLRIREVPMRNYLLRLLSPRKVFANKIIKEDLKYLKDANVDTIILLHYSYFRFQRTIHGFFNQKKQSLHGRDTIKKIFENLSQKENQVDVGKQSIVKVYHTGSLHLIQEKRREHMLSGGGKYKINYESIDLR